MIRHGRLDWIRVGTILVVLVLGIAMPMLAQTMVGDWTGVVSDPSGAAIPGAKVILIKQDTRTTQSAPTDATGTYRINQLLPGDYTIQVEAPNFKKYEQSGIHLRPTEVKVLDIKLEVGAVTQTVVVRDKAPAITTQSASLTTGINRALQELPLQSEAKSGYAFDMATWIPGSASGNAIYSFAGNMPSMDATNIEGISHNIYYNFLPTTAISEVNVVLSNAPAEYARPVTMDATIRSGTNRITGEIQWDFSNPCLNIVNTPFSQHPPGYKRSCPTTWYKYYTVGGPVYLPHIYDGRNKTFFFFTLNKNPSASFTSQPLPWGISVPTQAMIQGNYSAFPQVIYDPTTCVSPQTGKQCQPFQGNIIPQARFSAMAKAINSEFLSPSSPYPYTYVNSGYSSNATQNWGQFSNERAYTIKIDQNIGVKDTLNATYGYYFTSSGYTQDASGQSGTTSRVADYSDQILPDHNFTIGETHTFTPSIVNEFRAGITRDLYDLYQTTGLNATPNSGAQVLKDWGIQGISPAGTGGSGEPRFFITGWIFDTIRPTSLQIDQRWVFYDNVAIHRGKHTIKTGFSAAKLMLNGTVTGHNFGNFDFNGTFSGESYADFLLGLPDSFDVYTPRAGESLRRWDTGAFVQDDFRVNRKLTFSYGVRFEKFTTPYDKNGEYYNFNPATQKIVVPNAASAAKVVPAWPVNVFPVQTASQANYPSKLLYGTSSWQPRFGFAYMLGSKSVVRGGYGLYNGQVLFNSLQLTGPFAIQSNFVNTVAYGSATGTQYAMPNPFPQTVGYALVTSAGGISPHYRAPYSQNWNLTFEQEFARNWGMQFTYRGVKDTQLLWTQNLNEVPASANAFSTSRRPYPALSAINFIQNGANDHYDAFLVQVTHPWTSGLYMTAAYTNEHSDTTAAPGIFDIDQSSPTPEYSYNRQRQYGRQSAFPTNDFILDFRADGPFGKGKKFGTNANRYLNAVIGDWSSTGSFSWRSGWFFNPVLNGVDPGNIGNTSNRLPNLVSGCDPYAGGRNVHGQWFNPACFTAPPAGQLGNIQPNSLTGPGAWVFNMNPYKDFRLGFREGAKLRVGANIYNILNHPVYAVPNTNLASTTAGKVTTIQSARGTSNQFSGLRAFVMDIRIIF